MGELLLLAMILGVLHLGYRWRCRPRQTEDGDWLVVDAGDGPLRAALAAIALLASTFMLAAMAWAARTPGVPGNPLPVLLVAFVFWGVVVWFEGRKVREALRASPGELRVDNWPLTPGDRVVVNYKRALRSGRPAGAMRAALIQYAQVRESHGGKTRYRRETLQVLELTDGQADFRDQELEARWRFIVPGYIPPTVGAAVLDLAFALFSGHHHADEYWVLEVKLPLQDGFELDSQFRLAIK
jgi:hypothetical protein